MGQEDLARERTELADERTLLAYIRTSLSVFVFGIVVEKLYPGGKYPHLIFILSIFIGFLLLLFGFLRFIQSLRKMK